MGVKEESEAGVVIRGFCLRCLPSKAKSLSEEKLSGEEGDQQMETQRGNKKQWAGGGLPMPGPEAP